MLLLIRLGDLDAIRSSHGEKVVDEIRQASAIRLQQSVRLLDCVCRIDNDEYAVLMRFPTNAPCRPGSLRRIHQVLNLRAFKTSAGFLSASAALCMCNINPAGARITPSEIVEHIRSHLDEASKLGRVLEIAWPKPVEFD